MPPRTPNTGAPPPRNPGSLLGVSEIAEMLGVSRQRAYQLITRPDFPAPEVELTSGRVWRSTAVSGWIRKHRSGDSRARPA